MSIRVIDFKGERADEEFANGLREIGFAVIANHDIDLDLINKVYEEWFAFFEGDDKDNYPFDPKTHGGYIPFELSETAKGYELKDLKAFFHYYQGGVCPEYLREITDKLFFALSKLASTLLCWIEKYLPEDVAKSLREPLTSMIKGSQTTLFRLLYYPALTGDEQEGAVRAAAHEDINLLTVLPAATAAGLQVLAKSGKWLDVPRETGWIVVNAGDMLEECTNQYYPSTTHRVVNPEGEAAKKPRLSMPLFLHPRGEVVLSERHTAESYRQERFAELGLDE